MPKAWISKRIGELGRVVTGKTPSTKIPENFDGPYPFITIPDLGGRVYITETSRTLSEKGALAIQGAQLPAGAVMISCIATVGRCGITSKPSFTNQQINSVIPNNTVDARFLYYAFTQLGKELERTGGGGSVYTNVSKSRFSNILVRIPSRLSEQREIAAILGALDDKIELNRRMSETLEQLGRTEFERLVAVKPTCGLSAGDEWLITRVDTVAQISSGKRPPSRSPYLTQESSVPIWGSNGPMAYTSDPLIKDRILLTGRVGTLGNIFRVTSSSWPSDNTLVIRPMNEKAFEYLYFLLRTLDLASLNRGSTQPMLTQSDVKSQLIPVPPDQVLEKYYGFASLLFARIDSASAENQVLADIRDSLLPKLLSGELRVPEAEQMISEVV